MRPQLLILAIPALIFSHAEARAQAAASRDNVAVIDIPAPDHDFGQVYREGKFSHAFTVRNRGTVDLIIEDVRPSCGCTAAKFDRLIAPGGTGKVELEVDGSQVHGDFRKSAAVKSSDPYHPSMTLTISGNAVPYVNVAPEGTVLMHGRYGEKAEQTLTLTTNEKDLDFKVLGVRSNIDDKITYVLEDGNAPGEYLLHVYKNPKLPTLSTYGSIFVATNSTKWPETAVQVHVMTKGSIVITPSVLNYGAVRFPGENQSGVPETRTITVSRPSGDFKIEQVTVSNPNYRAVVDAVTPGQQYRVQVAFTPPARKTTAKQTESGEMIIHTDDPREPAVRVQLIARSQ
ncbi:MAG TPA: DUF1573 domain-containing protein [Candidatus Krumholzibacteria bacterium]